MSNTFVTAIENGFKWIGQEIASSNVWIPQVVSDADTVTPELSTLVDDAGKVASAAVKDSAVSITATETLIVAIKAAVANKATDVTTDVGVVNAFQAFVQTVTTSSNYTDLLEAVKQLTLDYEQLGTSVKTILGK